MDVTYHLDVAEEAEAARLAEAILVEQTVETPPEVAYRVDFVREHLQGAMRALTPDAGGGFRVTLSLPLAAVSDAAQLLNVVLGNTSLHPAVRLDDVVLPPSLRGMLPGPGFGLPGLRARLGVPRRPLTASALKPVGLSVEQLAGRCRALAAGGLDLVKDDHYLADQPFAPFEARVRACTSAAAEVQEQTGRAVLYAPHLSGGPDAVRRQAELAQRLGAGAVMAAPMLVGLPTFARLAAELDVPLLAHPSFAGTPAIRPEVLFGTLFRHFGADGVIFVNYGGRFPSTEAQCREAARRLRAPSWVAPATPIPAGGMTVERADELVRFFGPDVMLLVGGSLLQGDRPLEERTRAFVEAVHRAGEALAGGGAATEV